MAARKAVIKSIYQGGDNEFLAIIIIQELASVRCKLPVHKYEDIIVTSVVNNNVTILVGDTGSGKTTQVLMKIVVVSINNTIRYHNTYISIGIR